MRLSKRGVVVGVAVGLILVVNLTAFFLLPVIQTPLQTVGSCDSQNLLIGCVACVYRESLSSWLFGVGLPFN